MTSSPSPGCYRFSIMNWRPTFRRRPKARRGLLLWNLNVSHRGKAFSSRENFKISIPPRTAWSRGTCIDHISSMGLNSISEFMFWWAVWILWCFICMRRDWAGSRLKNMRLPIETTCSRFACTWLIMLSIRTIQILFSINQKKTCRKVTNVLLLQFMNCCRAMELMWQNWNKRLRIV